MAETNCGELKSWMSWIMKRGREYKWNVGKVAEDVKRVAKKMIGESTGSMPEDKQPVGGKKCRSKYQKKTQFK